MSSTPQKGLLLGLAGALLVFGLRSISKILVSGQAWVVLRKTLGLCWGSNISQSLWSGQYLLLCGFISEGEKRHTTFPAQVATLQSWVRSENTASHSQTSLTATRLIFPHLSFAVSPVYVKFCWLPWREILCCCPSSNFLPPPRWENSTGASGFIPHIPH